MSRIATEQEDAASPENEADRPEGARALLDSAAAPSGAEPPAFPTRARIGLFLGLGLFLVMLILPRPEGLSPEGQRVAAVALLMATWWMTEAIPLAATGLLPLALFPALGIMGAGEAAAPYANDLIFLFMAGFFIALAMQRWDLHRRIALNVVAFVGTEARTVVLGFMLATAFLSAWMSNTATTVMMLPIGLAILALLEEDGAGPLGTPLMLGIGYGASIGGIGTLIGTPPNAVFAAAAQEMLGRSIGFVEWMYVGVPLVLVLLPIAWWLLVFVLFPLPRGEEGTAAAVRQVIGRERSALGPMGRGERTTAVVFALTALAWVLRAPKRIGDVVIPGIETYLPMVGDSTIAVAGALALFAIPVSLQRGEFTLDWEWARRIPWGVLLLFGGGLSLAHGFGQSGLAAWIGDQVTLFGALPAVGLIAIVVVVFVLMTELASNTATATMGMPIMAGVAAGTGSDPLILMGVATLASSLGFMLPAATPPNAIVLGTGRITVGQMARAGVLLNIIGGLLITFVGYALMLIVFAGV